MLNKCLFGIVQYTRKVTQFHNVSENSEIGSPKDLSLLKPQNMSKSVRKNYASTLESIKYQ